MGITEEDKESLDKTLKDLKLTNQEVDRFTKAFKDPEFLKLFEDYAKEVSDPKVKEETDLYLRQLEMEGRAEQVYGKGVQLVVPTEAFVVKTRDKKSGEKVFINVCTSDKVDKPVLKRGTGADGKTGMHFDIPLSLGQAKQGEDKKGEPCMVWDFVVHPDTVAMSRTNAQARQILVDTAMEHIEGANEAVKLKREYKIPKINYKGTEACPKPHVLAVRSKDAEGTKSVNGRIVPQGSAASTPLGPSEPSASGSSTSNTSNGSGQTSISTAEQQAAARSKFAFPSAKTKQGGEPKDPSQAGFRHPTGETTPVWELVHRGEADLGAAWGDAGRNLAAATTCPKELVLRVQLPGVTSAGTMELDVARTQVAVVIGGRYRLEAKLPYAVDDTKGKAKFDKAKQQLEVVLPVVPPAPPPRPAKAAVVEEEQGGAEEGDEQQTQQHTGGASSGVGAAGEAPPAGASSAEGGEPSSSGSEPALGNAGSSTGVGASACSSSTQQASENQRKWMALHGEQQHAGGGGEQQQQQGEGGTSQVPGTIMQPVPEQHQQHAASSMAVAQPPPPALPPVVQLKPRLNRAIAEDLD